MGGGSMMSRTDGHGGHAGSRQDSEQIALLGVGWNRLWCHVMVGHRCSQNSGSVMASMGIGKSNKKKSGSGCRPPLFLPLQGPYAKGPSKPWETSFPALCAIPLLADVPLLYAALIGWKPANPHPSAPLGRWHLGFNGQSSKLPDLPSCTLYAHDVTPLGL